MILIDQSLVNTRETNYFDDIIEVPYILDGLPGIEDVNNDKYKGRPLPYVYRDMPQTPKLQSLLSIPDSTMRLYWCCVENTNFPIKIIMIAVRPESFTASACKKLNTIWKWGNIRATNIVKYHKIWGKCLFYPIDKKYAFDRKIFIDKFISASILEIPTIKIKVPPKPPKDRSERLELAKKFIQSTVDVNLFSYEDAYIVVASTILDQYVNHGRPYYMGGPIFHGIYPRANTLIRLTCGASQDGDPNYLWTLPGIYPIYHEKYQEYTLFFKELLEKNNQYYEPPLRTDAEIKKTNDEVKKIRSKKKRKKKRKKKKLSKK